MTFILVWRRSDCLPPPFIFENDFRTANADYAAHRNSELVSHGEGRETERKELTNPADGLLIGSPAPDFELPDVNGRNVSFENLLTQAKPILFFFVSPACSPCAALLPEIESLAKRTER
jgi:thiol-disulfide isomerase/thioredoxin